MPKRMQARLKSRKMVQRPGLAEGWRRMMARRAEKPTGTVMVAK